MHARGRLAISVFVVVLLSTVIHGAVYAGQPASLIGLTQDARPTVVPLPTLSPVKTPQIPPTTEPKTVDLGAHIRLNGAPSVAAATGMRAVVQWQAPDGTWFDVEGWQTGLPPTSTDIEWWVAPKDFGKGPFRWAVLQGNSRQPVQVSPAFWLPKSAGDWVMVALKPG